MKKNFYMDQLSLAVKDNDRKKALAALEQAKKMQKKVVFLPKGVSTTFKPKLRPSD